MKNLTLIVALFFVGWTTSASTSKSISPFNYGEAFIFVERGVEFAVYPNGEFDFYLDPRFSRTSIMNFPGNRGFSYNTGFNYDGFIQYDDYGAVIQIENVPVFYDYYGRIIQAGNVLIDYNRAGNISRVGGMIVKYNRFNNPVRYVGFINQFNQHYVYRPWHQYYARPHANYRVVYYEPYRAFYEPFRYDYGQFVNYYQVNNYYYNKSNFYRPGQQNVAYNYGRRTDSQRDLAPGVRSSENATRSYTNVNDNVVRSTVNEGRRSIDNTYSGRSQRGTENLRLQEAAVNSQRGRIANRNGIRTESPQYNEPNRVQERMEIQQATRRSARENISNTQQRQNTMATPSRESSSNFGTQRATIERGRTSSTVRSSEAIPSVRSGNDTRSSRGRG